MKAIFDVSRKRNSENVFNEFLRHESEKEKIIDKIRHMTGWKFVVGFLFSLVLPVIVFIDVITRNPFSGVVLGIILLFSLISFQNKWSETARTTPLKLLKFMPRLNHKYKAYLKARENLIDMVSAQDFQIEFLFHIEKLAEDIKGMPVKSFTNSSTSLMQYHAALKNQFIDHNWDEAFITMKHIYYNYLLLSMNEEKIMNEKEFNAAYQAFAQDNGEVKEVQKTQSRLRDML